MNTSFKYIQEKYDLRKHLKDLNKSKVTKKNKISTSETNTKGKKTPCLIYRVLSIKNCKNSQTKQESGYFIDNWKLSNWEKGLWKDEYNKKRGRGSYKQKNYSQMWKQ